MNKTVKFEDLTKEEQKTIKSAGFRFIGKMFLNGVNAGGLIFMSNLILVLVNNMYFNSTPLLIASCVIADIYFLNMMISANKETTKKFTDTVKQILDAK